MKAILSAKLRHKIIFLEKIVTNILYEAEWKNIFSTFAEIIPIDESSYKFLENFNFGQLVTEALFVFRIRYTTIKLNKYRIKYNDRLFDIKKITNIGEKNSLLSIIAVEVN